MTTHTPTAADAAARLHSLQALTAAVPSLRSHPLEGGRVKIYRPNDAIDADLGPSEIVTCKSNPDDGKLWFFDADGQPLIEANDVHRAALFFLNRLR